MRRLVEFYVNAHNTEIPTRHSAVKHPMRSTTVVVRTFPDRSKLERCKHAYPVDVQDPYE
ncbi:MAG: hypothetical protein M3436_15440 [Pseudomonadota bacterium]|nr:hypothetical protein [Pseudomonadota bacterium]